MSKRNLIILISAGVLIIITIIMVVLIYFREPVSLPKEEGRPEFIIPEEEGGIIPTPQVKVKALNSGPAGSLHLFNNRPRFWDKETGFIFETNTDGTEPKRISRDQLANVILILPLTDSERVVLGQEEDNQIKYFIYSLNSGTKNPLEEGIKSIAVSPNGQNIAFYSSSGGENNLVLSDSFGSNIQKALKLNFEKLNLDWVNSSLINLWEPVSGLSSSNALSFDTLKKQADIIFENLYGLELIASPDFSKILYSSTGQFGNGLSLYFKDLKIDETKKLNIPTFASKCVFLKSNREVFCAIPIVLPSDSVFPDDYYKGKFKTRDSLFKINLETAEFSEIINGFNQPSYDIVSPVLNQSEDFLFFTNNSDGIPYSIKL